MTEEEDEVTIALEETPTFWAKPETIGKTIALGNDSEDMKTECIETENGLKSDITEVDKEEEKEQIESNEIEKKEKKGIGKILIIGGIVVIFILVCFIFRKPSEEKKYEYVVSNYNSKDMQTYEYLLELKDKGYKDAEELYDDLYQCILTSDDENEEKEIHDKREEIQENIESESSENIWHDKKIYIDYVEYELDVSTLQSFLDNGWYKIDEEVYSYDINYANYILAKDEKKIYVSFSDEYTLGELTLKGIDIGTTNTKDYQKGVQQIKTTTFGFSEDLIFNGFSKEEVIKDMGGLEPYGEVSEYNQGVMVSYCDDEKDLIFTALYCQDKLCHLKYSYYGY